MPIGKTVKKRFFLLHTSNIDITLDVFIFSELKNDKFYY